MIVRRCARKDDCLWGRPAGVEQVLRLVVWPSVRCRERELRFARGISPRSLIERMT